MSDGSEEEGKEETESGSVDHDQEPDDREQLFEDDEEGVILTGALDDDDPDAAEIRKEKRKQKAEEEALQEKNGGLSGSFADQSIDQNDDGRMSRTLTGVMAHRMLLGIKTRGDLVTSSYDKKGQISDRKLKAMIKIGVLKKGWSTLYFYNRANGQLDMNVTMRANQMIQSMQMRGDLPHREIQASMSPQDVLPWQFFKGYRQKKVDKKREKERKKEDRRYRRTKFAREFSHKAAWKPSKGKAGPADAVSAFGETSKRTASPDMKAGEETVTRGPDGPEVSPP